MKKFILPVVLAIFVLAGTGLLLSAGNESEKAVEADAVENVSSSSCSDASVKTNTAMPTLEVNCDSDCTDKCGSDSAKASSCDSDTKADVTQKAAASSCGDSSKSEGEAACSGCSSEKA
jgi:hypothetical protein